MSIERDYLTGEVAREVSLLRSGVEDLERRIREGTPPVLTAAVSRGVLASACRLHELAARLAGVDAAEREAGERRGA